MKWLSLRWWYNHVGHVIVLPDWTCVDEHSFRTVAIEELPVSCDYWPRWPHPRLVNKWTRTPLHVTVHFFNVFLWMNQWVIGRVSVCLSVCLFLSLSLSLSRCERRTFYTTTLRRYDLDWKADLWKRLLSTRHSPVTQFKPHTITVDNIYNVFQQIRCGLPIRSALTMMKCFSFSSSIYLCVCLSFSISSFLSIFLPRFVSVFDDWSSLIKLSSNCDSAAE